MDIRPRDIASFLAFFLGKTYNYKLKSRGFGPLNLTPWRQAVKLMTGITALFLMLVMLICWSPPPAAAAKVEQFKDDQGSCISPMWLRKNRPQPRDRPQPLP